jgi:hypothetical protein
MNFWTIHIVLIAVLYTSVWGMGSLHAHEHAHMSATQICDGSHGTAHDGHETPCSREDCDARACCCAHNHHLIAFRSSAQGNVNFASSTYRPANVQPLLPRFSDEIFHPPVNG